MRLHVIATGSSGNCYILDDDKSQIMLDCGLPIREIKQAMDFDLSQLSGCLVTHSHKDHCKAVADLCAAGIDLYMSMGTSLETGIKSHRIKTISNDPLTKIGDWRVRPFNVIHDTSEPFGFWIRNDFTKERLIYLTDSAYSPVIFTGLDYMLVECNHDYESLDDSVSTGEITPEHRLRVMTSHFSLENCIDFIKENMKYTKKLKKIILLHASADNANVKKMVHDIQAATGIVTEMATAGLDVEL